MSEAVLKKFGKYFLLDRIGEGGMAEIFRARLASVDGAGRLLVIKRIQGAYSNNAEFVNMFKAEVQVTMRFNHPNIVQLYEAGEEQGQQFIAMELVDGRNLRQILSRLSHKQQKIPVPIASSIIENAAAGLHYAHTFRDRITGEAINLVHRDVSPQNILVSYDGNVKVIDFGIAKAATNSEATRAGVIKGKLSYLAPEQVMGEPLDARSDVFALGIVFWEMLTGKRLFVAEGENEFQVLKMIESCNTFVKPPSSINPDVPKELDQIVLGALTRDPAKRFQSADELVRAIRKFLVTHYPDFHASDLTGFVKKLFQDHIVEDRKNLQNFNARAEELLKLGLNAPNSVSAGASSGSSAHHSEAPRDHTRVTELVGGGSAQDASGMFEKMDSHQSIPTGIQPSRQVRIPAQQKPMVLPQHKTSSYTPPRPVVMKSRSSGLGKWISAAAAFGGMTFGAYWYLVNVQGVKLEGVNPEAVVQVISQAISKMDLSQLQKLKDLSAARMPTSVGESIQSALKAQADLRIDISPEGEIGKTKIWVNGQSVDSAQAKVSVPVGELIDLKVEREGYASHRREFTLQEADLNGSDRSYSLSIKLDPMKYGTLTLSTRPPVADVKIVRVDSGRNPSSQMRPILLKTPFAKEKLTAGTYRVTITNELLGLEANQTLEVREGKDISIVDLPLKSKR